MNNIKSLKKCELVSILEEILKQHRELIRTVDDKWYVEDSELGLYVKGILEVNGLIEEETIND